MTYLDLGKLRLRPGEELRQEQEIEISPLELGGQRYVAVPAKVSAELTLTKTTDGTVFGLRFRARLHGPCFRCLEDAVLEQELSLREYQAEDSEGEEELTTPYVSGRRLDLSGWARDSVALALPDKILCREDCAGLCPVCGRNLNRDPHEHEEEKGDSRWAALEKLRSRL
jgi:uncharacterized protein